MKFADNVEILGQITPAYAEILTPEAVRFLGQLARRFEATRQERLAARVKKQAEIDAGALPDFPSETAEIRAKGWTVAPIPKDLEDAARIDGCGRMGIWWHVAIPLARPALAVVALFTALNVWNEFIFAQLVLQNPKLMPLQLGLVTFWGGVIAQDHLLTAGMTISIIPIVIAYIFLQRHIIAGVTAGALKG